MILDELTLHDFGVYKGRQTFDLTPEAADRPIILIGARNGGGKTTFLEGLQLAFFGRQGLPAFRGSSGYDEYLRRSINRGAVASGGAAVEVKFRRTLEGREQAFHIKRIWSAQKAAVRETFEVYVDGELDRVLTAQWGEYVEEMLPPRIAPLFFFDGEKIEQFADIGRSSEIIATAISALLGLDIVERLQIDLDVFERRKAVADAGHDAQSALRQAAEAAETKAALVEVRNTALAGAVTQRARRIELLERARSEFKSQGGQLFEAREEIVAQGKVLDAELKAVERGLRAWAGELAPLMLVEELLGEVAEQAEREGASDTAKAVLAVLHRRDAQLLKRLKGAGANGVVQHDIQNFLDDDRKRLEAQTTINRYLDLSRSARETLSVVVEQGLPTAKDMRQALLADLDDVISRKDDADRKAAAIPAAETVAPLRANMLVEEEALVQAEAAVMAAERELEEAKREQVESRVAYQQILERQVQARLQAEDAQRMLEHSAKVRETLTHFRAQVVAHHVHRIEALILQALHALLHKRDLVSRVRIEPASFAITLEDEAGERVPPEQLSAGERQLFATALLWALARASSQAAPTVIDTPLGRLDSAHRDRLIDVYFPTAGHQVILLSTDEEIGRRHYERLRPAISRALTIVYDPESRASRVEPGYAFAEPAREMA
jgi:DNA sulfur modification protein DndD